MSAIQTIYVRKRDGLKWTRSVREWFPGKNEIVWFGPHSYRYIMGSDRWQDLEKELENDGMVKVFTTNMSVK